MAVVRPFKPNLAEMSSYLPLSREFDIHYYFTGIDLRDCRSQLDALGLQAITAKRYRGYTDFVTSSLVQRVLDFKVGVGSWMLSQISDALQHDFINIVDPLYAHTDQLLRKIRPHQKLVVVRWENVFDRYSKVWRAARFSERVLMRADYVICVSEGSLNTLWMPRGSRAKVAKIHPGIDVRFVGEAVRNHRVFGHRPTLLFVGREQWSKGLEYLLVAVAILCQRMNLPVQLSVIGVDEAVVRPFLRKLGLCAEVKCFGRLKNYEVREKMKEADVFCFPSLLSRTWSEQFGFAMVEAMAHALPVVAFDSGCIREICGPNGIYASAGNSLSLAEALATAIRNPTESAGRGERLRQRVLQEFNAETQGKRMLEFLS